MRVSKFLFCFFWKGIGTVDRIKNGMASCALVTYGRTFFCAFFYFSIL